MPSLRQKVTTYFRQLSFIAEPRDNTKTSLKTDDNDDENNFIIKYLAGRMNRIFTPGPEIYNGHNPSDMPDMNIAAYPTGPNTITAACTGPDDGLTGIKRSKLHLNANYADDIDFIDTAQENDDAYEVRKSIANNINMNVTNINSNVNSISTIRNSHNKFQRYSSSGRRISGGSGASGGNIGGGGGSGNNSSGALGHNNSTGIGNYSNANKTGSGIVRSRKNSRSSLHSISTSTTQSHNRDNNTVVKLQQHNKNEDNLSKSTTIVVSMVSTKPVISSSSTRLSGNVDVNDQNNRNLLNTKTDSSNNKNNYRQTTKDQQSHNVDVDKTEITEKSEISVISDHIENKNLNKLLEDDTERLLRNAVTSQTTTSHSNSNCTSHSILNDDDVSIAGVSNWKMDCDAAYGISVSLYENNMLTKEPMGNPIADCYGIVVRDNVAVMALADGVNWGDGARLAARSAVHGCLDYLDRAIFGLAQECMATTTQEVFVSLLRSLWEGHGCILEVGGALSTLTVAVVLPLDQSINNVINSNDDMDNGEKYVVCACNVGDSLGYVYSKKHGVREFTMASHDIAAMRDMRDALGALGPADGNKPELSNLTFSLTIIDKGDIVFLTSDGISDNFDPVVGKFAEAWTMNSQGASQSKPTVNLAPKRQNRSASALHSRTTTSASTSASASTNSATTVPVRPPRTKLDSSAGKRPKYMRSYTVIEPRYAPQISPSPDVKIPKSPTGLPLVTGPQRHSLTLYRLEDLLSYGINGTFSPCSSARRLCHLLIDFVRMITSARRKTLEQRELFYKISIGADGKKREIEMNRLQHRAARKRIIESSNFSSLPGKLDHASVVAFTAGGTQMTENSKSPNSHSNGQIDKTTTDSNDGHMITSLQTKEFKETNF